MKVKLLYVLLLTMTCFLLTNETLGQKLTIKVADRHFKNFAFMDAIEYYEHAYKRNKSNTYVIRQLIQCHNNIGDYQGEEKWLRRLIEKGNPEADDLYHYIQALKGNAKYDEAQEWLNRYARLYPDDERVNREISLLEYVKYLHRDPDKYTVRPVTINTSATEFGPAFYNGNIVFSSSRENSTIIKRKSQWDKQPFLNLYVSKIGRKGDLKEPKPFAPEIKSNFHEGPLSFSPNAQKMFLTQNNIFQGKLRISRKGENNLKIFVVHYFNDEWVIRNGFLFNSDEYSVGHPAIDKSGIILYYTSDMPGGYGGSDIYRSIYMDKSWSYPLNLGPEINTEGDEGFPFIDDEGVLYFASDGHDGLGGYDIFRAIPEGDSFTDVKNMGYPINSPRDDFSLVLNGDRTEGYFSSNRKGGKGRDDIYHMVINQIPAIIKGIVRDRVTREEVPNVRLTLFSDEAKKLSVTGSGVDGTFEFTAEKGKDYLLKTETEGYPGSEHEVSTRGLKTDSVVFVELLIDKTPEVEKDSLALPEPVGVEEEEGKPLQVVAVEIINYDRGVSAVPSSKTSNLEQLTVMLKQYPSLEVRIASHTDSRGNDKKNMLLSMGRAQKVYEFLVANGIEPERIQYKWFGETQLLNNCSDGVKCTEKQHAVNNRTVVKLVYKGAYKGRKKQNTFYF